MIRNTARFRRMRGLAVPSGRVLLALAVLSAALALALQEGDEQAALALAVPAAMALGLALARGAPPAPGDALTGLGTRNGLVSALDRILAAARPDGPSTAVLVIEIDRFRLLEERHDHAAVERILTVTAQRLRDHLRETDHAARLEGPMFAVALSPVRRLDLEGAIQLAGRLQRALSEPIALGGMSVHLTVSVGFALPARLRSPTGETLLQAAMLALIEAQRNGPGAIRSYSEAMHARINSRGALAGEVAAALERGEIQAYFQPQISTTTGAVTGFEALARWQHPSRGLIPPAEFLPAVAEAGLMPRLGQKMIRDALTALREWDALGLAVPRVGVNFSSVELCDPRLVDRIGWELDRFGLTPDRLVVEVLESVVASQSEDLVIRNLASLARLGCCLDLDDFGTGHASITSIRRFSIERIKIDRSFVTRIDEDPEQARMVSAILTMADRLGLDTLAEGVETAGEQAVLARLGCGHVQGFGIARPMPFGETAGWLRAWEARRDGGTRLRVV
ncbi:diguanylate cyclase/phosphodiesterase [Rubellimicrobium thermophilum DSM 16684]|uniref:Diguanylate cyclase/phosphodiesterase n=1 Tax=Rubellimicrobium thermophilum DSM 16684 TaxID=1123069 RepID=S9S212_9RHOB|nr:bifunctional diguanylate cyclase/phosphodiesterase [Rubellimicrobium thermophilum]EPX84265.1 diguanylate cyclase/phosphodiesterase [Rubellimicrobium thermophilum DSM 16684]